MSTRTGDASDEPRLDSWKEIASYLGRGIRTVQRWEREEGLPIHRLDHVKRGSVYASRRELTAWWESRRRPEVAPATSDGAPASHQPRLERVTATSAATFWPALSSDARMVVYVSDAGKDGESPQVWLQQVGGAAVQLTSGQRDCAEPIFSADDTRVLFTATGDSTRNVYEMPTLGGQPRLVKRAARNARPSPDGKWLAYIAIDPHDTLRLVPATGNEPVERMCGRHPHAAIGAEGRRADAVVIQPVQRACGANRTFRQPQQAPSHADPHALVAILEGASGPSVQWAAAVLLGIQALVPLQRQAARCAGFHDWQSKQADIVSRHRGK